MSGWDRKIHTETDMSAYERYIPEDWGERCIAPIPAGTVLERLILDLALLWRTVSYTAQMPVSSIRGVHAAAKGQSGYRTPNQSVVSHVETIIKRFNQRAPGLLGKTTRTKMIGKELEKIANETLDIAAKVTAEYPIEPIWAEFMKLEPFRLSLWSSQRVAYVSFYNAFEGFLVDCVKVAISTDSLKTTDEAFRNGLRKGFSKDIADSCWFHPEITKSKNIRHALSHNGGRMTDALKALKGKNFDVLVLDGELQIVPEDNHNMLRRLRSAVEGILTVTMDNPKFMAPATGMPPARDD